MDVVRRENSVIMLEDDYTTKYEGFDPSDPESYIFMNLMQNSFLEQSLKFAKFVDEEMKGGAPRNLAGSFLCSLAHRDACCSGRMRFYV